LHENRASPITITHPSLTHTQNNSPITITMSPFQRSRFLNTRCDDNSRFRCLLRTAAFDFEGVAAESATVAKRLPSAQETCKSRLGRFLAQVRDRKW
jgi:hypothetical protein